MSSIVVSGDTSGAITIAAPAVAGTNTLTLPASTGTVTVLGNTSTGSGSIVLATSPTITGLTFTSASTAAPAFSAYPATVTTSLPNATYTAPIGFDTEFFDTASCFNATNATVGGIPAYAFKPTTAGYYQIDGCVSWGAGGGAANYLGINKNGTEFVDSPYFYTGGTTAASISVLLYLNGTTDYIQFGAYQNAGSTKTTQTGQYQMYFQGFLARSA